MNRYRQNIQKQNYNALKNSVMSEYGITPKDMKTDRKELKSKSKSIKDILIAKNKKLPDSFKAPRLNQHGIKSPKHRQVSSGKKEGQFFQIWQKNYTFTNEKQIGFDGQKTTFFDDNSKIGKENNHIKPIQQILIKPQTYESDRVDAFELKQRLKKSTSMRNLIEQRFMYSHENEKNQQTKIEANHNKESTKEYDSTKYNWRLSKSRQKLQKQKSLSALSCKAKLMCDLQKKQSNRNKLKLENPVQNNNENRLKLKSQQILSFEYNPKTSQKKTFQAERKTTNNPYNLSYTFGSDVLKNFHFG